jgi:hypothetical protein
MSLGPAKRTAFDGTLVTTKCNSNWTAISSADCAAIATTDILTNELTDSAAD